jgi:hypothetical protein
MRAITILLLLSITLVGCPKEDPISPEGSLVQGTWGGDNVQELESILTAISHLPLREDTNLPKVRERQREKEVIRRRLAALVEDSDAMRACLKEVLLIINGSKGNPHSFDALEKILDDQAYRLSFWRVASDEINYRRFFDINDLAAIRVESPEVFSIVHRIPFELIRKSLVSGIRIDHPDGLFDPLRYFEDLQAQVPAARANIRGKPCEWRPAAHLPGRRKDSSRQRRTPAWLGHRRHHWLWLSQPAQRTFRGCFQSTLLPAPVPQVYRMVPELSGPDLREQAVGHAGFDVQRAQRAFAPPGSHF